MNTENYSLFNKNTPLAIERSLLEKNKNNLPPIIACIGSDLVLGDSLGPIVGTKLESQIKNTFIYGTLKHPVTAKEAKHLKNYLDEIHKNAFIIAIDAAVGNKDDVGLIKILNGSLIPGLGVNKKMQSIGDVSILGIVAEKSKDNFCFYNTTRLNLVYMLAEVISKGIISYLQRFNITNNIKGVI